MTGKLAGWLAGLNLFLRVLTPDEVIPSHSLLTNFFYSSFEAMNNLSTRVGQCVAMDLDTVLGLLGSDAHCQEHGGVVLQMERMCASCSAGYGFNPPFPEDGKRCAGCRNVWYCDKTCQTQHWSVHRNECKAYKDHKKRYSTQKKKARRAR